MWFFFFSRFGPIKFAAANFSSFEKFFECYVEQIYTTIELRRNDSSIVYLFDFFNHLYTMLYIYLFIDYLNIYVLLCIYPLPQSDEFNI